MQAQHNDESSDEPKRNQARATDDPFALLGAEWSAGWSSVLASATEAGNSILSELTAPHPSPTWDNPLGALTSEAGARASSLSSVLATATGGIASSLSSELSSLTSSLSAKVSSLHDSATATGTATGADATGTASGMSNPAPAMTAAVGIGALLGGAAVYANF